MRKHQFFLIDPPLWAQKVGERHDFIRLLESEVFGALHLVLVEDRKQILAFVLHAKCWCDIPDMTG